MQLAVDELCAPDTSDLSINSDLPTRTPNQLAGIVDRFAKSEGWIARVKLRTDQRWYERLYHGLDHDIWVISWLPGQSTGFHDHGESVGAFVVATGVLEEHRPGETPLQICPGEPRAFGATYAHDVRNVSLGPAISIHAYSPPLDEMNEYEWEDGHLIRRERGFTIDSHEPDKRLHRETPSQDANPQSIEQVLSVARARLQRLAPVEAYEALRKGEGVVVDIRPQAQRETEGIIPDALIVERNVLEWRFDPASSSRLSIVADHNLQVIVVCSEGYTSSLAAAALHDIGLWRATDVVGGYQAWRETGLPVVEPQQNS